MVENNINNHMVEENEIDIIELIQKLWAERKFIITAACIAMVVGIVIAFTTPKTYTANVVLAPESSKSASGSLASAASMLGLGNLNLGGSDADALRVTLYPDIVNSTPFIIDLMDTPVQPLKSEESMVLTEYFKTNRSSLMGTVISLPFKALGWVISLFKSDEGEADGFGTDVVDPFQLTKKQALAASKLRKSLNVNVNQKTGVTTVSVTMQDPKVAAVIADTLITKLKQHITKYRTSKAEDDCKYWEELCEQRQQEYYDAQKRYADYSDANRNVILQSVLNERERLQNEKSLALQLYTTVATQLQMARAKVQEAKPVFAVVEPATIPRKASSTSRSMTVMMFTFLGGVFAAAWILFGRDLLKKFKA